MKLFGDGHFLGFYLKDPKHAMTFTEVILGTAAVVATVATGGVGTIPIALGAAAASIELAKKVVDDLGEEQAYHKTHDHNKVEDGKLPEIATEEDYKSPTYLGVDKNTNHVEHKNQPKKIWTDEYKAETEKQVSAVQELTI